MAFTYTRDVAILRVVTDHKINVLDLRTSLTIEDSDSSTSNSWSEARRNEGNHYRKCNSDLESSDSDADTCYTRYPCTGNILCKSVPENFCTFGAGS